MEGDPRQGDDDHVLGNGVDDENEAMEEEGMDQLRTVSTNSVSGSGAGRQDRTTTTGRRRLRFQDNHHVVAYLPLPSEIEDSQRRDMWWGAQDYENFSIMARNIARETRRHRSLSIGLDEAYKKAAKASRIVDESTIELAVEKLTGNSVSLSYQLTQQLFRSCENVPLTTVCFPPKKGLARLVHTWTLSTRPGTVDITAAFRLSIGRCLECQVARGASAGHGLGRAAAGKPRAEQDSSSLCTAHGGSRQGGRGDLQRFGLCCCCGDSKQSHRTTAAPVAATIPKKRGNRNNTDFLVVVVSSSINAWWILTERPARFIIAKPSVGAGSHENLTRSYQDGVEQRARMEVGTTEVSYRPQQQPDTTTNPGTIHGPGTQQEQQSSSLDEVASRRQQDFQNARELP